MNVQIEESWKQHLAPEFEKDYFIKLTEFVRSEYQTTTIYPPGRFIFNAFNLCPFDKVKVVIYRPKTPTMVPARRTDSAFPLMTEYLSPSLQNIFKEIQSDLGAPIPTSGNLTRWANQGVLLLNATLTVRAHQAGSHQHGAGRNLQMPPSIYWQNNVKILYSSYGDLMHRKKEPSLDRNKHLVLGFRTSVTPVSL